MPSSRFFVAAALVFAAAPAVAAPSGEQELVDFGTKWVEAENVGDEAAIRAVLDDGFVATRDKTRKQVMSGRTVHPFGDAAVEPGTDTISGTEGGKPYAVSGRFTAIYAKRGGTWKAIALHFGSMQPVK